jgi:serine/threonine-protein kinase
MERDAAVKVLHRDLLRDKSMVRRFHREARAVARLSHPNIVTLFTVGQTDDKVPFIAMELVDGESLDEVLACGRISQRRAVRIARQIVSALADTHAAGIIHRDLKPANVLLEQRRRAADFVKVLDFGVAKMTDGAVTLPFGESRLTRDGAVCGTPLYISPEQANGDKVDHRADLYSLGVILFQMVTGEVPFDGSGVSVMLAHLGREVPRPTSLVPDLDPRLEAIILKCMAKTPGTRFQSAEQLADALDALDDEGKISPWAAKRSGSVPAIADAQPKVESSMAYDPTEPVKLLRSDITPRAMRVPEVTPPRSEPVPLPSPPTMRVARRSRWGLAAAFVAVLVGAGVGGWLAQRTANTEARAATGGVLPAINPTGEPGDVEVTPADPNLTRQPPNVPMRAIVVSANGYSMRVLLPERVIAGIDYELTFEVWDPEGEPLAVPDLIVTVDRPDGESHGMAARATLDAGRYTVQRKWDHGGRHILRVFPPTGAGAIDVFFDVIGSIEQS